MLQVEVPPAGAGQGRPTPLSAIDIEHEDFEWLRAYLQRNSSETTPLSDASTQGECVGRKHKSHHSSSHSTTSENYSTCDSPTEEHRTINSDSEGSRGDRRTRQAAQGRLDKHGGPGHPDVRAQARDAVAAHCKPASGPNCRCGEPGPPPRPSPLHALPPLPPRRGFRHPVPRSSPSELRASLDGGPTARPRLSPLLLACGRFATDGTASRRRTPWATARRVARRWMLCFSPRAWRG